jgi:hypothetical protein
MTILGKLSGKRILGEGSGMVVHAYNPSYLGGRDRRIMVPGQFKQKLVRSYLRKQAGWVCV